MSRRNAREIALKTLFALEFKAEEDTSTAVAMATEEVSTAEADASFALQLVQGVVAHQEELDEKIKPEMKNWKLERISGIDRNVLRLALYEMLFAEEKLSPAIAINEAVELAKTYGTNESAQFVNGVLGTLVKKYAS